jgi:hypothetical protein
MRVDHNVTVHMSNDPSVKLQRYGEYLWDHVVLMAPSADEIGKGLKDSAFLDYFDEN